MMSELSGRSRCIVTENELMLDQHGHKWSRKGRQTCLGILYGDVIDRSKLKFCGGKFKHFVDKTSRFASKNNNSGLVAVSGFKWMQSIERDWSWLEPLWKRHGVKVITLRRKDHVRTVVSRVINAKTRRAHPDAKEAAKIASRRFHFDTSKGKLVKHLRIIEKSYHELERFHKKVLAKGIPATMVYYESLSSEKGPSAFAALTDFLHGDSLSACKRPENETTARVHKIHSGWLKDSIANYDQVVKALKGTKFQKFIDADRAAMAGE